MKNKLIPIILVSTSIILFIVSITLVLNVSNYGFINKTEKKENTQSQKTEESIENNINKEKESNDEKYNTNIGINNNKTEKNKTDSSKDTNSSLSKEELVQKNESNVLSYFKSQDSILTENINQDDSSLREKAKNTFVTVVDFIFYDKEVKGYTFKDLTTEAKLKIIKLALSIDYKIDEYFPDYKEVIKDKYNNIKGKLAVEYLEFTSTLCEKVGIATCNQAKEDFNTMKESFNITWQLIKELASSGSDKVKKFYESWRDSE